MAGAPSRELVLGEAGEALAGNLDLVRSVDAGKQVQQSRFPRPGRTHERGKAAVRDRSVSRSSARTTSGPRQK